MTRPKHPNKEIESAIQYAESKGWRVIATGKSSHAWGRLYCQLETRNGCKISVWSTPGSNYNRARQIKRGVDKCEHNEDEG